MRAGGRVNPLHILLFLFLLLVPLAGAKGQAIVNPSPLLLNPTGTSAIPQGHLAELLQRNPVPSVLTQILNGKPTAGVSAPSAGSVAGRAVPLQVAGRVTGPALASVLGGALKRVALPVAAGLAIRGAYCELHPETGWLCDPLGSPQQEALQCYRVNLAAGGQSACIEKLADAQAAAVADYAASTFWHRTDGCWVHTPINHRMDGMDLVADQRNSCNGTVSVWAGWLRRNGVITNAGVQNQTACPKDADGNRPPMTSTGQCPTGTMAPATPAQVADRIVPELEKNIADHTKTLIQGGHDISPALVQESVTGPAKTVGETTTKTTTLPDGSSQTTTQTTEYRHQYNNTGGQLSVTTTTVNITNNNGTVTEEETSGGDPPEQVTEPPLPDMPPVPDLYERKYPDGMVGVWNEKSQELKQTPIFAFLSSLVPSLGDGGCPTWQMPVMSGIGQTWVADVSVPCWVWSALRAIFLCTALLLCRRLIFGG